MQRKEPWLPAYDLKTQEGRQQYAQDCAAVQAMVRGEADGSQQKRVFELLIYKIAGTYDMEFRPGGEDGRRASDFAAGKRYVGLQLVLMQHINPLSLLGKAGTGEQG